MDAFDLNLLPGESIECDVCQGDQPNRATKLVCCRQTQRLFVCDECEKRLEDLIKDWE